MIQITLCRCDRCGEYYNPSSVHKCDPTRKINLMTKTREDISRYLEHSRMNRACFLTREQYELILDCLEHEYKRVVKD